MMKFSIVIPALNEEQFLPNLLASLTKQTNKVFEVVVVDGSSRDRTVEIAQSFAAQLSALKVIISDKAGLPLQRNIGARETHGEWLLFIDADSVLLPYFIERVDSFIEEQKPDLFTSWFQPDSNISGDALFTLIANSFVEGGIYFQRPIAPGPFTAIRREVFDLVGGYNASLTFGEDYELTQRLTARGIKLEILRETLYTLSLRRVRRDGKLKFMGLYAWASLKVLLTKRNLQSVPSYVMGGQFYETETKYAEQPLLHE